MHTVSHFPNGDCHQIWLTLTELGRRFGISAVHCGHHLSQAGLRDRNGLPLPMAIHKGYAYRRPEQSANRSALWHRDRCIALLQELGLHLVEEQQLVEQWADLLEALHVGSPAILATPQEMADAEMPHHICAWVNQCLAVRGSQLRINNKKNPVQAMGASEKFALRPGDDHHIHGDLMAAAA